jgi:hypothetical protein
LLIFVLPALPEGGGGGLKYTAFDHLQEYLTNREGHTVV